MKYCLIGEKLSHSYSQEIHCLNGFNYSLREIKREDLEGFFKKNDYSGFNVTIPYKREVMKYTAFLSDDAKETGSVNTVVKTEKGYFGYNTDILGMEYAFTETGVSMAGKTVVILGSGGTSMTATCLAKRQGAKSISIVSRTGEINYSNCYEKLKSAEIIINTTPVGMFPNVCASPVDLEKFNKVEFVFDCVYNPLKTKLILTAERLNIKCDNGLKMLVAQALFSEGIWKGENPDFTAIEETYKKIKKEKTNIVLYGMPSCGKTSVGKRLFGKLGREFIDTDEIITEENKLSPSEIIERYGEEKFREIESEVIKKVARKCGVVISVGGGAVLRKENVEALKQNGILIYIQRNIHLLVDTDRPLSKEKGIERLYTERKDIYDGIKDYAVNNNSIIDDCVKEIVDIYENTRN